MKVAAFTFCLFLVSLLIPFEAQAQSNSIQSVEIKTSAQCEMCKDRIEHEMLFVKGVKSTSLNIENAILTVDFNSKKTDVSKLRAAINKVGYDADDSSANVKAQAVLPDCCKNKEE